jgi:xanthine dehydrogenase YagT iron-sulfur-binding subunit
MDRDGNRDSTDRLTMRPRLARRDFLEQTSLTGGALVMTRGARAGDAAVDQAVTASRRQDVAPIPVRVKVNGVDYGLPLDPRVSLLDLLREHLYLTGTKKGCNHGQCGACTVLVNGRRINACLTLAVMYDGSEITTVEGLASGDELHPVQAAFVAHDGLQCGYCTPGQICSAVGMLGEVEQGTASHVTSDVRRLGPIELTEDEVRERMSGNICRCGAYPGIVAAVLEASARRAHDLP